jgi:predicted ester cyclase
VGESNKAKARRIWEEVWPACDEQALAELVAVDSINHGSRPDEPPGLEGARRTMLWLGTVFSEQRWRINQVIEEGDTVVVHATHQARHTGDLFGIPPTGHRVEYDYIHIVRFENGKAAEHWGVHDNMTLMRQLGILPQMGPPVAAPA